MSGSFIHRQPAPQFVKPVQNHLQFRDAIGGLGARKSIDAFEQALRTINFII